MLRRRQHVMWAVCPTQPILINTPRPQAMHWVTASNSTGGSPAETNSCERVLERAWSTDAGGRKL
eukprot:5285104-Pyramimonas_sp.AAC.1